MEFACSMNNCSEAVTLVCDCKGVFTYFCDLHYESHCSNLDSKYHSKISLNRVVKNQEKTKIIKFIEDLVANENFIKYQILKLINEITKESERILNHSTKVRTQLKKMIKDITINGTIFVSIPKRSLNSPILFQIEELEDIKDMCNFYKEMEWNHFKINRNIVSFDYEKSFESTHLSVEESKLKIIKTSESHETLHIFGTNNELIRLDLSDMKQKRDNINFSEKLEKQCTLQLNQNELFILGGRFSYKNPVNYSTIILNLKTLQHEEYPNGLPIQDSMPVLLNEKVFIFGGCLNDCNSTKSQSFDLASKSWNKISDLPKPTSKTSTISVKNLILITSSLNNCLYSYSQVKDTYGTIKINSKITDKNVLVKFRGSIFLVSTQIYECNQSNINSWKMVNENGINQGWIVTAGIVRGNFAYFADCEYHIFKFDCRLKKLEVVTKVIL